MRIALTGTSSTGKTTLAERLMLEPERDAWGGRLISANARGLLLELGYQSVDGMTLAQRSDFQFAYIARKLELEKSQAEYLTDRSYLDIAAYWLDYTGGCDDDDLVVRCRKEVARYDLHFYFPVGLLDVEMDGFRSTDIESHERVDCHIRRLAANWGVSLVSLSRLDIDWRIAEFIAAVSVNT